jgi:hypothetical protein
LGLLRISDNAHNAGATDSVFLGNVSKGHPGEAITNKRIAVNVERRTTKTASLDLCAAHSGFDSFNDERPLQFGNTAHPGQLPVGSWAKVMAGIHS